MLTAEVSRSRAATCFGFALVVVVTVELAVWESFLVPARLWGHALPVAAALAVPGNVVLGLTGARVLRRQAGAVIPGAIWLAIALALGSRRPEGDLIVTGTLRGLAFLLAGTLAAAAAIGAAGGRRQVRTSPEAPERR